jgi:uncharacterized repeat protein (TIGR01451 family)
MRFLRFGCAALLVALASTSSYFVSSPQAISPDLVISQVYGAGGNTGALFNADYIELYNRGTTAVSLSGLSLQYASATGSGNFGSSATQLTELPAFTLEPGQYFLVQEAGGATGDPLPPPDFTDPSPIAMAAGAGKVALVRGTAPLGCNGSTTSPCVTEALARIIDLVGYGNANFFEGSAAAPTLSATTAAFRAGNGAIDTDNNGADFADDLPRDPPAPRTSGQVNELTLSIGDVSIGEGDAGVTAAQFVITLSSEAGAGGVTFDVATADGTAESGLDYIAANAAGVIAPGQKSAVFAVHILGDPTPEANETFFVNVGNLTGAVAGDLQAQGTVRNDDIAPVAIHQIQGTDDRSPKTGEIVATSGIVTGRKSNGFFLQAPDGEVDSLRETSEAIFVFTSQAPSMVAVGDAVRVSGTVVEFRRNNDLLPHTLTEIGAPVSVTVLSSGNTLPAPVDAATLPIAAPSRVAQLEPYESMLVRTSSLQVVAPTNGFGELYGVVAGTPRPFREPGIDVSDTLPSNPPRDVARFDGNHERLMVDTDESLTASGARRLPVLLATGATVAPVFGPLDYAFDEYRVSLDSAAALSLTPGMARQPLSAAAERELSIVSLNVLNFFPTSGSQAAQVAFAARVEEVAATIVGDLRTPDILGLIEVGDIVGLRQLRDRVNALAGTSYEAYLLESDDDAARDQDVGYLVNLARVAVDTEPYQIGRGTTFMFEFCDEGQDLVFDRPPLVLEARFRGVPVTVILNHLRSLIGVNSVEPVDPVSFPNCIGTEGQRVRAKRRAGAEALATAIEERAGQDLVVMGDMNAFEVNDGYGDIIGTLEGSPADPNTVVEPSRDDWTHTLTSLARLVPAGERYSYVHQGNAQVLDHILVNRSMLDRITGFGYARVNADFPEDERLSDHDAAFARFAPVAQLSTTTDLPATVVSGSAFSFDVTVSNAGPDRAETVVLSTTLPPGTSFDSAAAPDSWACAAAGAVVNCASAALAPDTSARVVIRARAACDLSHGAILSVITTASSPDDRDVGDNGSSDIVAVSNPAPVISNVSVDQMVLWPANHTMREVVIRYTTSDNCGTPTVALSVTSNEPVNGVGDGDTGLDWEVIDSHRVRLRAERAATGAGRTYTIRITATDSVGNASTQTVFVGVPHSQ